MQKRYSSALVIFFEILVAVTLVLAAAVEVVFCQAVITLWGHTPKSVVMWLGLVGVSICIVGIAVCCVLLVWGMGKLLKTLR